MAQYRTTMHEKVKQFLEKAQQEEAKERTQNLIKWGFVEKVECSKGEHDSYYYDADLKRSVYFKRVVIDVTDQEYRSIAATMALQEKKKQQNLQVPSDSTLSEDVIKTCITIELVFGLIVGCVMLYMAFQPWMPTLVYVLGAIGVFIVAVLGYCVVKVWLKQAYNIATIKQAVNQILIHQD